MLSQLTEHAQATTPAKLQALYRHVHEHKLYSSPARFAHYAGWVYGDAPLAGRRVLEVGCGEGLVSLYAACRGARRVVGLEPETDGASDGMLSSFRKSAQTLGLHDVEPRADGLEAFAKNADEFDVIVLCQVINHIDEDACQQLHRSESARARFLDIFATLRALLAPGGTLILTDCGRTNLLRPLQSVGFPHPFAPTIEWEKHQNPELWTQLLRAADFERIRRSWRTPSRLRRMSWAFNNRLVAQTLTSEFRIEARRPH